MSGVEAIGLISGLITIVATTLQLFDAAADASGLPQSFRDVAARLPLVQDTLEAARAGIIMVDDDDDDDGDDTYKNGGGDQDDSAAASRLALATILGSCHDKAVALNKVLRAVMPAAGASRMRRYLKAAKTIPNADKVDSLMGGILADLEVLTGNHAVKAAMRAQMERRLGAAGATRAKAARDREVRGKAARDWPHPSAAVALRNLGTGSQFVHTGQGHQNMASGGIQINGATSGPLYFPRAE